MISVNIARFLNEYFDKILVVSVPRFTDRHERVMQRLQGINFEFFWGADKNSIDFEKAKQDGTYDEAMTKKLQRMNKALSPGELACSLSHRYVYEAMIQNNWHKVLVLEDDVWPLMDNLSELPTALNELHSNWDLVYLGYLRHEAITFGLLFKQFVYRIGSALGMMKWNTTMVSHLLPKPYSPHLKKAGFHDCTHAYAISLNAAKKMSAAQNPVVYRADDLLSATTLKGEISSFVTVPKFFDQEDWHTGEGSSKIKE
ncbi:MAG TPA: glycosyltransferase family 25 protein [Ferruginibacter sp.]|nr:glycosyltransferase family 25 protein [Ferruginibacter sp.]